VIIDVTGLAKRYGRSDALIDLTMQVEPGEVFGFLGPNGAGKTTAVKLLLGLARPTRGSGTVLGAPLGDRAARERIGYLPELFRYQPWLRAREVLELHARLIGAGSAGSTASTRITAAHIDATLDEVGLRDRADDLVGGFSKGMQQRLGLAVALLGSPALIVLDEPTSALDPVGRMDVRSIIGRARDAGSTVFLNSHLLGEVEMVCDRVAIVDRGHVVRSGPLAELLGGAAELRVTVNRVDGDLLAVLNRYAEVLAVEETTVTLGAADAAIAPLIAEAVLRAGYRLYALVPVHRSLEDVFLGLVEGSAG